MGELGWDAAVTEALANSRETILCVLVVKEGASVFPPPQHLLLHQLLSRPSPPTPSPGRARAQGGKFFARAPNNQLLLQA